MTAGGATNENDTVHFKEWMAAIKHKNRYTTSRDEWLQLEWLNRLPLKNRMRKKGLLKKVAGLNKQLLSKIICSM